MEIDLPISIMAQPDDTTCGPTCLHSIYRYYRDEITLDQVIDEVQKLKEGGSLAVLLACHAVKRGYRAKIYTNNLQVFDPSWFIQRKGNSPASRMLIEKLSRQNQIKNDSKLAEATQAYLEFLNSGGEILFQEFSPDLIKNYISRSIPILTGLSATYLYRSMREYSDENSMTVYDDIEGYPTGHFIIIKGISSSHKKVYIADPYRKNPFANEHYYSVTINRLIHSILLGILTYDANLLVVTKP